MDANWHQLTASGEPLNLMAMLDMADAGAGSLMFSASSNTGARNVLDMLQFGADYGESLLQALTMPRTSGFPSSVADVFLDISSDSYHADESIVTRSKLDALLRSPKHYKHMLANPKVPTDAMVIGTAVHTAVLEPEKFSQFYVGYSGAGNRGSKEYKAFAESHPDKVILTGKDYQKVIGIRDAVMNFADYPLAPLIQAGEKEKTLRWVDPKTGLTCQIRPDLLLDFAIFDLKKCADARPHRFMWSARDLNYDLQAAMYRIGVRETLGIELPFIFIAVEEDAPHGIKLYEAPDAMLQDGEARFHKALETLLHCRQTNTWPGYERPIDVMEWRPR